MQAVQSTEWAISNNMYLLFRNCWHDCSLVLNDLKKWFKKWNWLKSMIIFFQELLQALSFPVIIGLIVFRFHCPWYEPDSYIERIKRGLICDSRQLLCVFSRMFLFFCCLTDSTCFVRLRGILAATIIWAIIVFMVKFLLKWNISL